MGCWGKMVAAKDEDDDYDGEVYLNDDKNKIVKLKGSAAG